MVAIAGLMGSLPSMPRTLFPVVLAALVLAGCLNVHMKVEPVEVNVHGTLDVNVKVERALDDFFGDLDQKSTTLKPSAP
ncbi:MAG: hypothetical protein WCL04_05175 [Verrucomicrobiota bacterium]